MKNVWILVPLFGVSACSKNKTSSYWKMDRQEYWSDNVVVEIGKAAASINCRDAVRFNTLFSLPFLPTDRNLFIDRGSGGNNPNLVMLTFYKDTVAYVISTAQPTRLMAEAVNGKARYTLVPTWFINYIESTDSVLIEAVINEP